MAELRAAPWHPRRPVWERLRPAAFDAWDWWEERAAIVQYDGGESQGGAEEIAYMLLYGVLDRLGLVAGEDPDRVRQLDRLSRQEWHWTVGRIKRAHLDASSAEADRLAMRLAKEAGDG